MFGMFDLGGVWVWVCASFGDTGVPDASPKKAITSRQDRTPNLEDIVLCRAFEHQARDAGMDFIW